MKIYMIRKTLENEVKEYASAGLTFSTKSSKGWGRKGNIKNAIACRAYNFGSRWDKSNTECFLAWLDWESKGGKYNIDVLEIDIDNVTITETPILDWYNENMKKD